MFDPAQEVIFDRYKHPRFSGRLEHPDWTGVGENRSCGDEVSFMIRFEGELLAEIRHQCRACAICTASADLLAEELEGKSVQDLSAYPSTQIVERLGIPLSPTRLKCALLPLETLQKIQGNG